MCGANHTIDLNGTKFVIPAEDVGGIWRPRKMITVDGGEDEFANEFLTITKGSDTIVLDRDEIVELMVETLDIHGWPWLKETLEDEYIIYINM